MPDSIQSDVTVTTALVQVRTVKLTKSLLAQVQWIDTSEYVRLKTLDVVTVVGWVNGEAIKRPHDTVLLIEVRERADSAPSYVLFSAAYQRRLEHPQLFVL